MSLWNIKNLPAPTINTYKLQNHSIDLPALRAIISDAYSTLTKSAINKEAAFLSRSIYRMKKKFRNDKGFKCMEKMNRALLQMLRMRFADTLQTYLDCIPWESTYLPTLNMLHYILVRLQGLSKLLVRLCEVSKCAACFVQERVYIAHMWKVAFIMFSMISRIYVLGKDLLKFCCEFYGQLLPYCSKFKNVGVDWLPKDYHLPPDLKTWLDIDWLDYIAPSDIKLSNTLDIFQVTLSDKEDIGESVEPLLPPISITNKLQKIKKSNRRIVESLAHSILCMNSIDDLKSITNKLRNIKTKKHTVFKNIDQMQCNMFYNSIKRHLSKARKHNTDNDIVSQCLLDARKILTLHFMD